jgi:hypothetical protein
VAADASEASAWDESVHHRAKHCMVGEGPVFTPETLEAEFAALLDAVAAGKVPEPQDVLALLPRLPPATTPRGRELLLRALRSLRPAAALRPLLEACFDALRAESVREAAGVVRALLREKDTAERGVALHLIQRSRDPAFVPDVEEALDRAAPEDRPSIRRTLWWLFAGATGIEPATYLAFVARYAGWVAEAPDAQARGLATGLLDLGEAGAEEFARGLRGPRSRLYVEALAGYARTLPLDVAEALLGLVDAATPVELRHAIFTIAYATAPAEAADAMAEARARLDSSTRPETDGIFEAVRHRARR